MPGSATAPAPVRQFFPLSFGGVLDESKTPRKLGPGLVSARNAMHRRTDGLGEAAGEWRRLRIPRIPGPLPFSPSSAKSVVSRLSHAADAERRGRAGSHVRRRRSGTEQRAYRRWRPSHPQRVDEPGTDVLRTRSAGKANARLRRVDPVRPDRTVRVRHRANHARWIRLDRRHLTSRALRQHGQHGHNEVVHRSAERQPRVDLAAEIVDLINESAACVSTAGTGRSWSARRPRRSSAP